MTPINNPLEDAAQKCRKEGLQVNVGWGEDEGCLLVMCEGRPTRDQAGLLVDAMKHSGLYLAETGKEFGQDDRITYQAKAFTAEGSTLLMMYRHPNAGG